MRKWMCNGPYRFDPAAEAADDAWAKAVAAAIAEALWRGRLMGPESSMAVERVVAEEIRARLAAGDRPSDLLRPSEFVINCSDVTSRDQFWSAYVDEVQPQGALLFGRNLEAFWDAVSGGGPGWPGKCVLRFTHSERLAQIDGGRFFEGLKRIAAEAEQVRIVFD